MLFDVDHGGWHQQRDRCGASKWDRANSNSNSEGDDRERGSSDDRWMWSVGRAVPPTGPAGQPVTRTPTSIGTLLPLKTVADCA